MAGVFISYRRDDSAGWAGRIYDRAVARLGVDRVLIDIDAVPLGEDFTEVIEAVLSDADAVVVVIGSRWLAAADAEGGRRIDDPDDYLRREIELALRLGLPIVPVLVDNASMPVDQDLPEDIRLLAHRNAVVVSDIRFDRDVEQVFGALERVTHGALTITDQSEVADVASRPSRGWTRRRTGYGAAVAVAIAIGVAAVLWLPRSSDDGEIGAPSTTAPVGAPSTAAPTATTPEPIDPPATSAAPGDVVTFPEQALETEWSTAGGNQQRTGMSDATGLPDEPTGSFWDAAFTLDVAPRPAALYEGELIVGGRRSVYFVDASTGELRAVQVSGSVEATPTVVDDLAYVGTSDGWIYGISTSSAEPDPVIWRFRTGGSVAGSPAVVDKAIVEVGPCTGGAELCVIGDVVIAGSADGHLYAINARNSGMVTEPLWRFPAGDDPPVAAFTSSPALWDDGHVFAGTANGILYRVATENGAAEECARVINPIEHVAVSNGLIYVAYAAGDQGVVDRYTAEACEFIDSTGTSGPIHGLAVDESLQRLVVTAGRFLEVFPLGVNSYAWLPFQAHSPLASPPVVAGGVVYFGDTDGNIYAVEELSGDLLWESVADPAPVVTVANDVIYVVTGTGAYAFGSAQGS